MFSLQKKIPNFFIS